VENLNGKLIIDLGNLNSERDFKQVLEIIKEAKIEQNRVSPR